MSEHVISHRRPRRKRSWSGLVLRRFGALAITILALGSASWIAPYLYRPAPAPRLDTAEAPSAPPKAPPPVEIAKAIERPAGAAPVLHAERPRQRRRGVPLNAHPGEAGEDYEVLTAAELDAISQARD